MSERKQEIIKSLRSKGIDPITVEKEVVRMLRKGASSLEVREYFKKLLEGEKQWPRLK